jgi:hypothetical protein
LVGPAVVAVVHNEEGAWVRQGQYWGRGQDRRVVRPRLECLGTHRYRHMHRHRHRHRHTGTGTQAQRHMHRHRQAWRELACGTGTRA